MRAWTEEEEGDVEKAEPKTEWKKRSFLVQKQKKKGPVPQ